MISQAHAKDEDGFSLILTAIFNIDDSTIFTFFNLIQDNVIYALRNDKNADSPNFSITLLNSEIIIAINL